MRILGVRHHSPACAHLVAQVCQEYQPEWVLIEAPADFNERISELLLSHQLPIAIFTFARSQQGLTRACWTPFCEHSPEWVALQWGQRLGSQIRFFDLPSWSRAFEEQPLRYRDRQPPSLQKLAQQLGFDDSDRLWDSLFEQRPFDLESRLRRYFLELRQTLGEVEEGDRRREAFMGRYLAWAKGQSARVLVVCGGYHAPFLEQFELAPPPQEPHWDGELDPPEEVGNYLVPYSYARLDSFRGYPSGMPSPHYQQLLYEKGAAQAAQSMLAEVAARLRQRRQSLSTADLIGAHQQCQNLARLRGHQHPLRTDLLDGLASALVKEALHQPLPWSQRGSLESGSDPILVEMVAAFCGQKVGQLDPATPRPPLLSSAYAELQRWGLLPTGSSSLVRSLNIPSQRPQSALLHRLRLLAIPGFTRQAGPHSPTRDDLTEVWELYPSLERETALIERSSLGPDLASACVAWLTQEMSQREEVESLVELLFECLWADLPQLAKASIGSLPNLLRREFDPGRLGAAMLKLAEVFAFDEQLGGSQRLEIKACLEAGFGRLMWLLEGDLVSPSNWLQAPKALLALHRLERLELPRECALELMIRLSLQEPALRAGAANGYLCALDQPQPPLSLTLGPASQADYWLGLLSLARVEILRDEGRLAELDRWLREWSAEDFLIALPSLRLAFAGLPPMERDQLARQVVALYGQKFSPGWLRLKESPQLLARAQALAASVESQLLAWGLP